MIPGPLTALKSEPAWYTVSPKVHVTSTETEYTIKMVDSNTLNSLCRQEHIFQT